MNLDIPKIVLLVAGTLLIAGVALHGIGWSEFQRIGAHVVERPGGSLALRFILQPAMSSLFALRDGIRDARTGRSPYFWTVLSDPDKRNARLREGLAATGKIILIAVVLDGVYQYIAYKTFYPAEALLVAILLAFIPYVLLRGPFARLARWWSSRSPSQSQG
ncbi:MAG: hypothetical protein AB7V13_12035 [Pseudorhodoplanes sp.]|uniref:hypothetical protein n=1 Tax=Pseudorhodoplanes sp. TaxID=1934341 RepID=UPI003D0E8E03